MSTPSKAKVEVSRDALGWLLVYARDADGYREGDPVGEPDYYKSKRAAAKKADEINLMDAALCKETL